MSDRTEDDGGDRRLVRDLVNQAIYGESKETEMAQRDSAPAGGAAARDERRGATPGAPKRDLATVLTNLRDRLDATDQRQKEMARALGERVETLRAMISAVDPGAMERRLDALEAAGAASERTGATLKGLQNAIGQIADHIDRSRAETKASVDGVASRLDEIEQRLQSRIDDALRASREIAGRVDDLESGDASADAVAHARNAARAEASLRVDAGLAHIVDRIAGLEDRLAGLDAIAADDAPFDKALFGEADEAASDPFDFDADDEPRPPARRAAPTERAALRDKAALQSLVAKSSRRAAAAAQAAPETAFEDDEPSPAPRGDFLSAAREAAKRAAEQRDERPQKSERRTRKDRAEPQIPPLDADSGFAARRRDSVVELTEDAGGGSRRAVVLAILVGAALIGVLGLFATSALLNRPSAPPAEAAGSAPARAAPSDPVDLYRRGAAALEAGDDAAAAAALAEASDLGYPPAQYAYGQLHEAGRGVPADAAEARRLYRRAAEAGNRDAMHLLGVMAARGRGGPKDDAAAVEWFKRAAELGLVNSQFNLGAIFQPSPEKGPSDLQDAEQSYFWFSLAAANGDAQAIPQAARVGAQLPEAVRLRIDGEVEAWTPRAPDPAANDIG